MDFDQHADSYQQAVDQAAGVSVEKLAGEKARMILKTLADCVGDPKQLRVLDIGCGIGLIDRDLGRGVAELCGVDTSLRSLELARARAPGTRFIHYDGERLPFDDSSFRCGLCELCAASRSARRAGRPSWPKCCGRCAPKARSF